MKHQDTIYYDVTQLAHWTGKITGIPRVMQELAVRFLADDPSVRFVSWVKEVQGFAEIDFQYTIIERRGIAYITRPAVEPALGNSATPGRQHVSHIRGHAVRVAKAGLRVSRRLSPTVTDKIESRLKQSYVPEVTPVQFAAGDVLVIPWGEWWDERFIMKLENLHADGVRLVQVLHDMSPIVVPQFSNSGNATETYPVYCRRVYPLCDLILSVSQNSKRDAETWLKAQRVKVPRIEVFRLGDDIKIAKPIKPADPVYTSSGLKGQDYVLTVGTVELKKNHMLLYYVYKLAHSRGIELPKLVVVGRQGWMSEPVVELMNKDPEVRDRFVLLHDASDEELSWLYDHALFTVLPSFYEGWGIPIAESVARGVPCLCSSTSSMVEIAEDCVEHFNPASTDECLDGMVRMLKPGELARQRKQTGKYVGHTWDDSYAQIRRYINIYVRK